MNKFHYELTYIIDGNVPETENAQISHKIQDIIKSKNGEIKLFQEFGRKKLSYEIKKSLKGTYFVIEFESAPTTINLIEKDLKLEKGILRHIIVKKPKDIEQVNPDNVKDQSEIKSDKEKRERPQQRQDNKRSPKHEIKPEEKQKVKTEEPIKEEIAEQIKEETPVQETKTEEKQETQQETQEKDDKDDLDKKLDELLNKDEF